MFAMMSVLSSTISAIGYDEEGMVLRVSFKSGDLYEYYDVPSALYLEFKSSTSLGKFLHARIKDKYRFQKIS